MNLIDPSPSVRIKKSYRVDRVASMFDLEVPDILREHFKAELPSQDENWKIGLIVGPSGSGKSTIARTAYPRAFTPNEWGDYESLLDSFPESMPIKRIVELLIACGFSSPPSWIKPHSVLSTGEQFRCDMALAFANGESQQNQPTVIDEFTSVVDREVAKSTSMTIKKAIEKQTIKTKFVAVTCHYDIAEWLEPDWIFDMATGTLTRECLRRPNIEIHIEETHRKTWEIFAKHHYLSNSIFKGGKYYLAKWEKKKVAFLATIPQMGYTGYRRISRVVVLPDYQGIGVGSAMTDAIAIHEKKSSKHVSITTSHPAMIAHLKRSKLWEFRGKKPPNQKSKNGHHENGFRPIHSYRIS